MYKKYLFIDLDGTILDVSDKFYNTYKDILTRFNQPYLPKSIYWELKRNKTSESTIHQISGADKISEFSDLRKNIIETSKYQKFDTLHERCYEKLMSLSIHYTLILVTLRHSKEQLEWQLKQLNIYDFFDAILSAPDESIDKKWKIKSRLIDAHFNGLIPVDSFFIGDTETDIYAGKELSFKTVAVLSGMRNYSLLQSFQPDYIIPSLSDLII